MKRYERAMCVHQISRSPRYLPLTPALSPQWSPRRKSCR